MHTYFRNGTKVLNTRKMISFLLCTTIHQVQSTYATCVLSITRPTCFFLWTFDLVSHHQWVKVSVVGDPTSVGKSPIPSDVFSTKAFYNTLIIRFVRFLIDLTYRIMITPLLSKPQMEWCFSWMPRPTVEDLVHSYNSRCLTITIDWHYEFMLTRNR